MRILYIFPHPDDESFEPAGAIHQQIQAGHEVFLLTLTKEDATKVRFQLGLSVQEMGEVREKKMHRVQQTLGLTGMTVLDYEDGGLSKHNLITLEKEVRGWIAHYTTHHRHHLPRARGQRSPRPHRTPCWPFSLYEADNQAIDAAARLANPCRAKAVTPGVWCSVGASRYA